MDELKPTQDDQSENIPEVTSESTSTKINVSEASDVTTPYSRVEDLKTEDLTESSNLNSSNQPAPVVAAQKKKSKAGKILKVLIVLLLMAGIAGAGWYFWTQSQPIENAQLNNEVIVDIENFRFGSVEGPANSYFPEPYSSGVSFSQSRQMYEGLVGSTNRKFTPLLATSWTNPDEKTWIFKLKPDVKFHTGKVMTAEDVKSSLDSLKDMEFWSLFVDTIESIEVVSDNEVKIVTTEPDALLLNKLSLAFIHDTSATDTAASNGTGAYQIDTSKENNEEYLALKTFDDYHAGRPKVRYTEYKIYQSEEEVVTALKNNEIDYAEIIDTPKFNEELTSAGFTSEKFDAPGVFGLYLNMKRSEDSPLNDPEVRKAIALAVNRNGLVEELPNEGVPATQVVPESLPGHDASIKYPDHNLELAKSTLLAARPEGVTLEYAYFEGVQADAPIIMQQLRDAGFTIVEKPETDPTVLVKKLQDGDMDLFSGSYSSDISDSRDVLGAIFGSNSSFATLDDEKYDKILLDSDTEFDPTKRIALLQSANKYLADNLYWIPLRKTLYTAYYPSDVTLLIDYEGGANLGIYHWKLGRKVQE